MEEYSEAFVAFDVAKRKQALAIAEGGRRGEVRFVGEVENSPAAIERTINNNDDRSGDCTIFGRMFLCNSLDAMAGSPSASDDLRRALRSARQDLTDAELLRELGITVQP